MKRIQALCFLLTLTTFCGCASTSLFEMSKSALKAPVSLFTGRTAHPPVSKILCLWEPAEGQGVDGLPSRGFAGQIIFFGYGQDSPVKVDGTIRILEYDNYDEGQIDPTPVHRFTFDSVAWDAHRTEGTIGHAYNVFIPYSVKHMNEARCALRIEFTDNDGRVTTSPYTEVALAAKSKKGVAGQAMQRGIVQASRKVPEQLKGSGIQQAVNTSKPKRKLESTSIQLPSK